MLSTEPIETTELRLATEGTLLPIGDINADGMNDFVTVASEERSGQFLRQTVLRVVFGAENVSPEDVNLNELNGQTGFVMRGLGPVIPSFFGETGYQIFSSDLNDDGIDDLIVSTSGDVLKQDTFCGAYYELTEGGALTVFGEQGIGIDGEFQFNEDNHASFPLSVPFYDSGPWTSIADVNRDGVFDLMVSGGGRGYVTFGGEEFTGRDFGVSLGTGYQDYVGHDGFAIRGLTRDSFGCGGNPLTSEHSPALQLTDTNNDGIAELVATNFERVALLEWGSVSRSVEFPASELRSTTGDGALDQRFTLSTGQQVVFSVKGTLRADTELSPTIIVEPSEAQSDSDLRNNAISPQPVASVFLDAERVEQTGDSATYSITLANPGPVPLNVILVRENITELLDDPVWSRRDEFIPSAITLEEMTGNHGVRLRGADTAIPFLSQSIQAKGFAGDVNGDGFDDIVVSSGQISLEQRFDPVTNPLIFPTKTELVFGSADFGQGGQFAGSNGSIEIPHRRDSFVRSLGDINDDGFDDFWSNVSATNRAHIHLGTDDVSDGLPVLTIFGPEAIEFSEQGSFLGDYNGDGVNDLLIHGGQFTRETSYVVFGPFESGSISLSNLDGDNGFRFQNPMRSDPPVFVGDINGDGRDELALGDSVVLGGTEPFSDANEVSADRLVDFRTERQPTGFGDVNGDGVDDSIAGSDRGFVVKFGGTDQNLQLDLYDAGRLSERSWTSGYDMNGDGADEILLLDEFAGDFVNQLFLVFGRREQTILGTGGVEQRISVPPLGSVEFTITGTPRWEEPVQAFFEVELAPDLLLLSASKPSVEIVVEPSSDSEILGDLNDDGLINLEDFLVIANNFGRTNAIQSQGDLNDDATVDFQDFLVFANAFQNA